MAEHLLHRPQVLGRFQHMAGEGMAKHVRVQVLASVPQQGGQRLRISVTDNGIGIAEDMQAKIFEKFSQADTSSTRRHEGTGLGLAIVKHIMNRHRGALGIESVIGSSLGDTFTLTLNTTSATGVTPTYLPYPSYVLDPSNIYIAGTISGTVLQGTSSAFWPRSRPANWYSDRVSGTGVTAARMVPGSAPSTTAQGRGPVLRFLCRA